MSTVFDIMLSLLRREGYRYSAVALSDPDGHCWYVEASRSGHQWWAIAPTRYDAAVALMRKLGYRLQA